MTAQHLFNNSSIIAFNITKSNIIVKLTGDTRITEILLITDTYCTVYLFKYFFRINKLNTL